MKGETQSILNEKLIKTFEKGELSLGKMANLLKIDKAALRKKLSEMNIPVINEGASEAIEEAKALLNKE